MAEADESNANAISTMIDEIYEFSAPKFFDFINGETEEDKRKAELWFDSALSYAPSPFMARIKTGRSIKVEALCNFGEAETQAPESSDSTSTTSESKVPSAVDPTSKDEGALEESGRENLLSEKVSGCKQSSNKDQDASVASHNPGSASSTKQLEAQVAEEKENINPSIKVANEACTPKPPSTASTKGAILTDSKRHQTAKKIASLVKNPSALKPNSQLRSSQARIARPVAGIKMSVNVKTAGTPNLNQENQAIKRQKLEGGKSRQILNVKPPVLPHKTKSGLVNSSNLCNSVATKANKEARKVYVRNQPQPTQFISTAEMIKKFQSSTRDLSLPNVNSSLSHDTAASIIQTRPRLTLTRPKEPEFETAQRFRSVKVKSTAELEEEMMTKIPKFKARPVNKKILEAPKLPVIQRSAPKPPEFQEFHLETMARANQNAESASVVSTETSHQNTQWKPRLTEPKSPLLQTSLRARPPSVKTSIELEQEELEKLPKFKARPLNKKIFESKGNMGIFCNTKKHVTIPQEFHFATDGRFPPPAAVIDLFDKLSLTSESQSVNPIPRNTAPSPFHLHTEERGAEKERKFMSELMQKQMEEERARIPKANPYPYTTDYPVVPPKPEPKHFTRLEPFQLESLVRHEEELKREMEERKRKEKEEAQLRIFKAQPVLKEDPIPVLEKARIPLTEVQGFNLHVDNRAVERAEFDEKIKEKEMLYKRYREESEAARMLEEERALKQLRTTMVPHARPLPKFDHPFYPQKSSKEPTKPKSPNLRVLRRKERRNLVAPFPAISAAAAHMR